MKKILLTLVCVIGFFGLSFSQDITQTVKGKVFNKITQEPIVGANITLIDSQPLIGTMSNLDGGFLMKNVPVGRRSFKVSMLGYETIHINDILVSSGKQVLFNVKLQEVATQLNEIVLTPKRQKEKPLNTMATLSSRQFTVEESERFAGGLNDPARLVSSFAGVAAPSISSNGISVRGNSPSGLLWRIEGVEIPSPNHFADLEIAGAGALTVLSSQVMGNSDFYTGAFPAEYGNATSGVFDINLRSGNESKREYTAQAGILGIDFATEGPFTKGKDATYLVNYRYSTLALITPFLPSDAGILKYQDLSYKIKLPTKNTGTFSIWGIGAYDSIDSEALEQEKWESDDDRWSSQLSQYLLGSGLNHKLSIGDKSFLNSTLAFSGNGITFKEQYLEDDLEETFPSDSKKSTYKLTFQSQINTYFNNNHYNRTGFYVNRLGYDLEIKNGFETLDSTLKTIVDGKGNSMLYQFFSQSKFKLNQKLVLNAGLHFQYFELNKDHSLEPRIALKYNLNQKQNLSFAYGRHSRIESLPIYFVNVNGSQPNKDLKLMKSNHFVISYDYMPTNNLKIIIEPYYQSLTDVPVAPTGYISTLNLENSLFFDYELLSSGKGRNIGVDLSLERYLNKGLYYVLSASFFDSKYTAIDGVERNTIFNKNYVINALIGKEWQVGKSKNNLLSANIRLNYLGGNRIESIDEQRSIDKQDVVYGETNGELSFAKKFNDVPITSFSVSFRKNKKKHASVWSLQVLNSGQTKEFDKDIYNLNTGLVETKFSKVVIPNLSYKIEF
ncbi:TonB-dependent receptor [uncultured Algibacter sp.]|uniref:TonB-dependent receptor n=1 Tax=uncultured Algibacter sp. TaxID=298659 RepID=UPI0026272476|nr:TonB-dependent receptor [uncultured Algibacter sp.]